MQATWASKDSHVTMVTADVVDSLLWRNKTNNIPLSKRRLLRMKLQFSVPFDFDKVLEFSL